MEFGTPRFWAVAIGKWLAWRGLGAVAGVRPGSVATKTTHLSDVPVLLVK